MLLKDPGKVGGRRRLQLEVCDQGASTVVRCQGRICFREEALNFSQTVTGLLRSGNRVVLEFSGVEMLDSAGIGELVQVHMQSQAAESTVCLVSPTPRIKKLLELTNVASLFAIHPTVEDALHSLAARAA